MCDELILFLRNSGHESGENTVCNGSLLTASIVLKHHEFSGTN